MDDGGLQERGFAIVDGVVDPDECDALAAAVAPAGRTSAGTRNLPDSTGLQVQGF